MNGVNSNNIRYADDTVPISKSQWQLQKMINELEKIGEQYGMPPMSTNRMSRNY